MKTKSFCKNILNKESEELIQIILNKFFLLQQYLQSIYKLCHFNERFH